ncbi:VWA domain-containing protein [Candidatus Chloroploca sp. M-50]|uniref:VWA domain-containing protein n=1 Tax=Candidatus Chloroploca mongolica TaxID=2528176 RepID=A0ABS4D4T4_9CHLR|nr:vWA domain-containing protein [Candidatus Chloroploca mongolica]MBP1464445.1 VWA domain-containing protein [Candidatus Chloroploca mongolica]
MKVCSNCGAHNGDAREYCYECGNALAGLPEPGTSAMPGLSGSRKVDPASLSASIAGGIASKQFSSGRRADVMFVLDCTGSMAGEIRAIRDAIIAFANTIESDGVRVRVGLIEFRDRLIHEEARVLTFSGQPFTSDPGEFRKQVSKLSASGGGDEPESSLDALILASRQPFGADNTKVIVLVTDAPPHIPDKDTKTVKEVVDAFIKAGIAQFYMVIRIDDPRSQVYLELLTGRQGLAFDIGKGDDFNSRAEHFKRTLMNLGKTLSGATR